MKYEKIFVAVHGIGDQKRSATVRSVALRLARSPAFAVPDGQPPLSPQPLGHFHRQIGDVVPLYDPTVTGAPKIGFSEVFWAHVPQEVAREQRTLEETKAWGRTIIARARALCARAKSAHGREITPPDFSLAGEVLDEVIETVYVLENLTFLAEKAGLFSFDLRTVLEEYLGDVQLVAEFQTFSNDIVGHFHEALAIIHRQHPDAEIHVVAHSEGTVVAFLGLLMAMSRMTVAPMTSADREAALAGRLPLPTDGSTLNVKKGHAIPDWLRAVHGLMTIGSPIDKHLLLWRRLWRDLHPADANGELKPGQIEWRNYYDFGDPIGFKLETARDWLELKKCACFNFCGCDRCKHDIGFARYFLPGQAHNDYWEDPVVFEHFVQEVGDPVRAKSHEKVFPEDRWAAKWLSPLVPYLLSFLLLLVGTWILYRSVSAYTQAEFDGFQQYVRYTLLGLPPTPGHSGLQLALNALGLTVLFAGATLLARLPRLAMGWVWWIYGALSFLAGAWVYTCVPAEARYAIGSPFAPGPDAAKIEVAARLLTGKGVTEAEAFWPTYGVIGAALVVALVGGLVAWKRARTQKNLLAFSVAETPRRQRWFLQGMRPLILSGALGVLLIVGFQLYEARDDRKHFGERTIAVEEQRRLIASEPPLTAEAKAHIKTLGPTLQDKPPLWPVLLGTAGFLYLWWLAALIFDLSFVWQRYIRQSAGVERLKDWWVLQLPDGDQPAQVVERARGPQDALGQILAWIGHRPSPPKERHRDPKQIWEEWKQAAPKQGSGTGEDLVASSP